MSDPITWLQLSDLHLGCRGREEWFRIEKALHASLTELLPRSGPPALVLVTGDLTFSGQRTQFDLFDEFWGRLVAHLGTLGAPPPLLVPVPGNHDLGWPTEAWLLEQLKVLEKLDQGRDDPEVARWLDQLWQGHYPAPLDRLFREYQDWLERAVFPAYTARGLTVARSWFPGDHTVLWPWGDRTLGLVALNSAWVQYRREQLEGEFRGRLHLPAAQLQAALPAAANPLDFFDDARPALLLTHHPADWFSPRTEFERGVHVPGWFRLFLHGHLHEGRSRAVAESGGHMRQTFQAASLFGVEHWGTSRVNRAFGYAWGRLDPAGGLRLWPLTGVSRRDGSFQFVPDHGGFTLEQTGDGVGSFLLPGGESSPVAPIRTGRSRLVPLPPPVPAPDPVTEEEQHRYREWALREFGQLEMVGVGANDYDFPMEQVYVPLRLGQERVGLTGGEEFCWHHHLLGWAAPGAGADGARADEVQAVRGDAGRDLRLAEVFPRTGPGQGALFLGLPGAGKTTVLRKLLHQTLTEGGPSLGLPAGCLPLLLRLRHLTPELLAQPLTAWLARELQRGTAGLTRPDLAERLWHRGRLLLLFDGLDEVPGAELRAGICRYLEEQVYPHAGRAIFWAVACRYAGYDLHPPAGRPPVCFRRPVLHLEVRPLDDDQIRALAGAWIRQARRQQWRNQPDGAARAEEQAAADLARLLTGIGQAGEAGRRLRELVSCPLLLTLLCVLIIRGKPIPRRRVEFYEKCLEVLLGQWSRGPGLEPLLAAEDALAILRPVALALHRQSPERQFELRDAGLEAAAQAFYRRAGARLSQPPSTARLRDWLVRGAGVLSEFAPGEYGFVHLGLQEYLTAVELNQQGGPALAELARRLGDPRWQEVILLLLALHLPCRFEEFMAEVVAHQPLERHLPLLRLALDEAYTAPVRPFLALLRRTAGETLLGRWGTSRERTRQRAAVLELFLDRDEPELQTAARPFVDDPDPHLRALARLTCGLTEVRPPVIIEAGLPGGAAGREPLPAELIDSTTGLRFLLVPGGEFTMGADDLVGDPSWPEELRRFSESVSRPAHRVRLAPCWLAVTPVTNEQYRLFLEDREGQPAVLAELAAEGGEPLEAIAEPQYWRDRRFAQPRQPVVGVTWGEARAFCRWLTRQRTLVPSQPTGSPRRWRCDLPTEAQWERAARGADDRPYPWGQAEPDPERANFGLQVGAPSPVGRYPTGAGPYGHLDLAGNVWEWCRDGGSDNYAGEVARGDKDPVTGVTTVVDPCRPGDNASFLGLRVVRGGSWFNVPWFLRCAFRLRLGSGYRDEFLGLRVVCVGSGEHA